MLVRSQPWWTAPGLSSSWASQKHWLLPGAAALWLAPGFFINSLGNYFPCLNGLISMFSHFLRKCANLKCGQAGTLFWLKPLSCSPRYSGPKWVLGALSAAVSCDQWPVTEWGLSACRLWGLLCLEDHWTTRKPKPKPSLLEARPFTHRGDANVSKVNISLPSRGIFHRYLAVTFMSVCRHTYKYDDTANLGEMLLS